MPKKLPSGVQELIKKGLVVKGSDPDLVIKWATTGISRLDDAIGGGLPQNRFVLLTGHESAGKTLLCQSIAAAVQRNGGTVALIDAEISFDPRWWQATGVDTDELILAQPPSGEAAVDIIVSLIGNVDLIIIDSMAALIPLATQDKSATEADVAPIAKVHNMLFYRMMNRLPKSGTTVIGINQQRESLGGGPGAGVTFPGGRAQRFYAHLRLEMYREGWMLGGGGMRIGAKYKVRCAKNKTGKPNGEAELAFNFEGQFDKAAMIVSDAQDRGVIKGAGAYYRFPTLSVGEEQAEELGLKRVDGETMQVMGRDGLHRVFTEVPGALDLLEEFTYAGTQ